MIGQNGTDKKGYVKSYREWEYDPVINKDTDHLAVWSYLLWHATHQEYPGIFKGKPITLKPGQLITGRKVIADAMHVNESKVRRVLADFKNSQLIDQQPSNQNSLISLLFWDSEQKSDQQNDQQMTNERPTSDQPVTTYKNKRTKNKENNIFKPPALEEVQQYCHEKGIQIDCQHFIDYHSARGWELGKGRKMKDWKAAVRTWETNQKKWSKENAKDTGTDQGIIDPEQRSLYEQSDFFSS